MNADKMKTKNEAQAAITLTGGPQRGTGALEVHFPVLRRVACAYVHQNQSKWQ